MNELMWLGIRAFVISLVLTPIVRDIFRSYGLVDQPDAKRKMHAHPIPRVGGIAIAIAYFGSVYLGDLQTGPGSLVTILLPSALLVFAVGLIDDLMGLKPWQKLAGQAGAAMIAYWSGIRIVSIGGYTPATWVSVLLTIAWLMACANAFNLVDGLDGLAAGVGLFATLTMFTAALLQHNIPFASATLPLAGCLLAFLCYNFNPATVFLGDCGSLLTGFLLGCYGVAWFQKSITLLGMTAPLMALSIPLLDVVLAMLRRFLRHQPIFGADRGHIHHRLIDLGLTPRRAVLVLYGVCGVAAGLSLLQTATRSFYFALLVALLFCIVSWIGIRYLSYSEFILAGRFVRTGEFQRALNAQLAVDAFSSVLVRAGDTEGCWRAIRQHYQSFGFSAVHLRINGVSYREWGAHIRPPHFWTVRVPVTDTDFVEFAREAGCPVLPLAVAAFADVLSDSLARLARANIPGSANAARMGDAI